MRFAIDLLAALAALAALAPLGLATNDGIHGGHGAIELNNDLNKKGQDQSSAWTADKLIGGMGHGFMPSAMQEDNRILLAACTTTCADRPIVEVSGADFGNLVSACIPGGSGCPPAFNEIPLNCWDTSKVTDMEKVFRWKGVFNSPLDCWDTSSVTNMKDMFNTAQDFNQPIGEWDVSSVTAMKNMFFDANAFNHSIGEWDVSSVTNMYGMFKFAHAFNQPIGDWDVSGVDTMRDLFGRASTFNQTIGGWDVSGVTNMNGMFNQAHAFNQAINEWDTSSVTDMFAVFYMAQAFNQAINEWDVSSVTDMEKMFYTASAFNQPIGDWDVSSVSDMESMLTRAGNFNQCLGTWAKKTPSDVRTTDLFLGSACSVAGIPVQTTGPWCQTPADSCSTTAPTRPTSTPTSRPTPGPGPTPISKRAISRYEILAAGDGTESAPYAIVETLEPFSGKVYFEAPSLSFISNLGDDTVDLVFEMYGDAGDEGDCDSGKNLTISDFSLYFNSDSDGYDTTTSDGVLGVASFSIKDFQSANLGATIFTQSTTSNEAGTIAVCARIVFKVKGTKSDIISYVDTRINLDVDLTANFETFTQEVKISGTGAKVTNTDIVKVIDLESFLCGTSGVNNGKPSASLYKIGQDFQVCVQPTEQYAADYSIESFKNVTCSNTNLERKLITIDGVEDALTDTIDDVTGSKTADGALSFVAREGGKAFKSVVTAGYFDESAETPETSFSCTGEAVLTYSKSERSRFLVGTWTHSYDPTTNDPSRDLQETSTTELGPFATTIGLSNDGVDVFTAPAFLASHGWSSSLIVGVAGAAMIAIAVI